MVFFNPATGLWRASEGRREGGYIAKTYGEKFQGYDSAERIQWFKGNAVGDYNGDGRADIAFFLPESGEFQVAEHNGDIFQYKRYGALNIPGVNIFNSEWFPGDFDGNGLSDNILFDETTGSWILMRNLGGYFEFAKFSRHFKNLFRDDYSPDINQDSPNTLDNSGQGKDYAEIRFFSGDYNGDGRTDIGIYDARSGKWFVGENHRDSSAVFKLNWKLYKVFTAPEQTLFSHKVFSGDYNGDGLSDFLIYDSAGKEWILGETGDATIRFKIISRMPERVGEITRWLNGDYNGDGRSDVAFYSSDDDNFWVGESVPGGLRYRIYGSMKVSAAPDSETIMATPAPKDEVVIASTLAVTSAATRTDLLDYEYNGNPYGTSAETGYPGYFKSDVSPTLVLYDRGKKSFYEYDPTRANDIDKRVKIAENIDLSENGATLLNFERPIRYLEKDALLYHQKETIESVVYQSFKLIQVGAAIQTVAEVSENIVHNFDIQESLYLTGHFADDARQSLLFLDDQALTAEDTRFYLFKPDAPEIAIPLSIDEAGSLKNVDFFHLFRLGTQNINRQNRGQFRFFSGDFQGTGTVSVLMADRRQSPNRWYLGTLDLEAGSIRFDLLNNGANSDMNNQGFDGRYLVRADGKILYAAVRTEGSRFNTLTLSDNTVSGNNYQLLDPEYHFDFQFDHNLNPVLTKDKTFYTLTLSDNGQKLEILEADPEKGVARQEIKRPDLVRAIYPYRWIQGDYNGDNKTDIGIFHLGEPVWYFANTSGTVSDLMEEVKNGIGGTYSVTYINSTTLDNTGEDDIADLPLNYRVCSGLKVNDGLGNETVTGYHYENGFAFSAFIDGIKETDYFGFTRFTVIDAAGGRTIQQYYNTPYDNYRKNRALSGAIRQSLFVGVDSKEYSKTEYRYTLHEIKENEASPSSFLIEPTMVAKYVRDHNSGRLIPHSATTSEIILTPARYRIESKSVSVTDFYSDAVHQPATLTAYEEYEYISGTNQTRIKLKKTLNGSPHEITTTYDYDNRGNLTLKVKSYTGTGLAAPQAEVTGYDYDNYGNLIRLSDLSASPARITESEFDTKLRQFITKKRRLKENGHLENSFEINYAAAFGLNSRIIDPNNNSRYFTFDSLGRLSAEEADTRNGRETLATFSYSAVFPLSAKTVQYAGDGTFVETRIYTDGRAREVHTIRSALDIPGKRYIRSGKKSYDMAGRLRRKSQPDWAFDNEIEIFRFNHTEKHPTVFEYDGSGRKKRVISPAAYPGEPATYITYTYHDPWRITETHSLGRGKSTVKNARNQVLYVTDFGTGDDNRFLEAGMGFAYDTAGNRVKKMDLNDTGMDLSLDDSAFSPAFKDSSGFNITYFKYDGFNRMIANYDPDRGYSEHRYNAFGEKHKFADASGRITSYYYDRLGRMVKKLLPGSEGSVTYTYDSLNGGVNLKGRLAALDDPAQRKTFSYDKLGRRTHEKRTFRDSSTFLTAKTYETTFTYDLLDRIMLIDYPEDPWRHNSVRVGYGYNGLGLVNRVNAHTSSGTKEIISNISYDPFKQFASVTRGNGVRTDYTYDDKRRLSRLISLRDNDSNKKLQDVSYTFDSNDNISGIVNHPNEAVKNGHTGQTAVNYQYDGLNRLIDAEGVFTPGQDGNSIADTPKFKRYYQYALNGNMTRKDIVNPDNLVIEDRWNYAYNNHQATAIASSLFGGNRFTMRYDAVGNMTGQTDNETNKSKQMIFTHDNRIAKVYDPGTGETIGRYVHDDQGFRVYREARYKNLHDLPINMSVIYPNKYLSAEIQTTPSGTEISGTGAVANHIYLNGVRIAAIAHNGYTNYYLTDQVDSVKLVTDDDGSALTRFEYLPYGESWFTEGQTQTNAKYNNQELDRETGYYYYNARHYDPQIARFTAADSIIDGVYNTQGWNRYSYVKGNPIRYKDPTGREDEGWGDACDSDVDDGNDDSGYDSEGLGNSDSDKSTKKSVKDNLKSKKGFWDTTVGKIAGVVLGVVTGGAILGAIAGYGFSVAGAIKGITALGKIAAGTTAAGTLSGAIRGGLNGGWAGAWKGAKKSFTNSAKIWGSPFSGNGLQALSKMTWELPQTLIGIFAGSTLNISGNVMDVNYYKGSTHIMTDLEMGGAFTIGGSIFTDSTIKTNSSLYQHEYGHYLQSQKMGWGWASVGASSLYSYRSNISNHHNYWTEKWADNEAKNFFGDGYKPH